MKDKGLLFHSTNFFVQENKKQEENAGKGKRVERGERGGERR
jgi:hypothetical protein